MNARNNNGVTALMVAAAFGHTETVKALLAKGADVNAKDKKGDTARTLASRFGRGETEKVLLAAGAE